MKFFLTPAIKIWTFTFCLIPPLIIGRGKEGFINLAAYVESCVSCQYIIGFGFWNMMPFSDALGNRHSIVMLNLNSFLCLPMSLWCFFLYHLCPTFWTDLSTDLSCTRLSRVMCLPFRLFLFFYSHAMFALTSANQRTLHLNWKFMLFMYLPLILSFPGNFLFSDVLLNCIWHVKRQTESEWILIPSSSVARVCFSFIFALIGNMFHPNT